ncbi:hypothetical protein VNO78_07963 [Psophocarpus tetragonolobus]|uniref:Uncharacterized protein n=1 Tax=Psophocarpus tetragonolobus TaxID=3891 RepID=A0AAN9SX12_PSOTE
MPLTFSQILSSFSSMKLVGPVSLTSKHGRPTNTDNCVSVFPFEASTRLTYPLLLFQLVYDTWLRLFSATWFHGQMQLFLVPLFRLLRFFYWEKIRNEDAAHNPLLRGIFFPTPLTC